MSKKDNIYKKIMETLQNAQSAPKKRSQTVLFDSNTDSPWKATFSERGFSVDGTRLSFEVAEDAISKSYMITLESGLVLDGVKFQKILKYKTLY